MSYVTVPDCSVLSCDDVAKCRAQHDLLSSWTSKSQLRNTGSMLEQYEGLESDDRVTCEPTVHFTSRT